MFNRPIPVGGTKVVLASVKQPSVLVFNRYLGRMERLYPRPVVERVTRG